jgi:hypothetical protein
MAPTLTEANRRHGEVKAIGGEAIVHEIVDVSQHSAWPGFALELMQGLGVNAIGHECRPDAMARHIAYENGKGVVIMREDHAKIATNGACGTVVTFDGDIRPSQALWCK